MPVGTSEKRKQVEVESSSGNSPRKRPLYDAFQSLSLQNQQIRDYETRIRQGHEKESAPLSNTYDSTKMADIDDWIGASIHPSQITDSKDDIEMRERASYSTDAHTVFVNSLDDDSDIEPHEDEAQFMFNLPGMIDKTFSGIKAIPEDLMNQYHSREQEGQLVLYSGTPDEVIGRALVDHIRRRRKELEDNETPIIEEVLDDSDAPEDSMDID